jgi:hypothetical protein
MGLIINSPNPTKPAHLIGKPAHVANMTVVIVPIIL